MGKRKSDCTPEEWEQIKAAQRIRYERYKALHPDAGKLASRRYRELHGNEPWPAKRALGLEVEQLKASTPCIDCGNTFPSECMDFDHLDGRAKINNVGTMVSHGHNRDSVMAEIAKCEIICANCHRIRTRKRRTNDN